ncbi:MAG: apolipoprotein N-acyltransferase [Planctomycetes bacterium]|nr:apolipoprotein N-acyltransferase [Planctomycetota bacterium]
MDTACMEPANAVKASLTPRPESAPTGHGLCLLLYVAAAASSSVLLWLCFHPIAWGFLGWIALAPFLVLVRAQVRPTVVYGLAFLCGLGFFIPVLSWMRVADRSMVGGWLALSVYCALYFPAALFCVRCLERWRVPLVVSFPLTWVALEYFRSFFLTGFAWYYLAHTQHDFLSMIQITDLGGIYLVTWIVAAVNALVFDSAYQFPEVRQWFHQRQLEAYRTYASIDLFNRGVLAEWLFRRNLIFEAAALGALLIGVYWYGEIRLRQNQFRAGPVVCLLQSNLDQRLRENAAEQEDPGQAAESVRKHFTLLCMRAAFNHQTPPDLLIWPETSFPRPWYEVSPKLPLDQVPPAWRDAEVDMRDTLEKFAAAYTRVPHLLGINSRQLDEHGVPRQFNSALLLGAEGRIEGKFDKVHRLPFGEYIPLKNWFPFLSWLTPYEGDFGIQKGEKLTRFKLGDHHFGVLICFEDTDPFLARQYVEQTKDGPPVDFLVNMSNDGWFDGSAEHEAHLAVCRFRAIETRRAMVRAVNMGISAVIDSNGRILKAREVPDTQPTVWMVSPDRFGYPELPTSEWGQFKKKAGVLKAVVPIDNRASLYVATGDVLPMGCWAILLGGGGWSLIRRRRSA